MKMIRDADDNIIVSMSPDEAMRIEAEIGATPVNQIEPTVYKFWKALSDYLHIHL
jgi:hypothetical protein